ncbi:hypothetical protein [Streptomyces sp. NPDC088801]|uniref:hypothetical protein n=1 Tax=Streptomyces sp. NPDC088801 TaxID=3365903 RepID=UPI00382BBEA3
MARVPGANQVPASVVTATTPRRPALGRLLLCGLREPAPPGAAAGRADPRDPAGR